MKKLGQFIKQYQWFVSALAASAIALGLDLGGKDSWAHWLLIITTVVQLFPLLWGMVRDLQQGSYGIDILAATAIVTSLLLGQYWAGMVIIIMLTGGKSLEDYAEHRAKRELDALLTHAPQKARILRGTREVEVTASAVHVGDKLVLRPGEVVPVDARIVEGSGSFDESSITGESLPQLKQVGEDIVSGSINQDGALVVQALHAAADSQYEQIIKLVRAAQNSKAPFVRMADRYAIPFTIVSFGVASVAWILTGDSLRFLQVLVVATPCPLILAAPIAIISGMSRAAKHGIIIKTGSALERLAEAPTFAFDKTGTLTQGRPVVATVQAYGSFKKDDVLSLAAALEQKSNHVLAEAITAAAETAGLHLKKANHLRELAGSGLLATISGKQVLVGRLSLLQEYAIAMPAKFNAKSVQTTAAFVAVDGQLAGAITFTDEVRPESKATISALKKLGVKTFLMITGDNTATAQKVAKQVGIAEVHAEALPGDKIRALESAVDRPVVFVGDGVNDAPVLTASEVGIALGARGSTAASESADVVILPDSLSHVAEARQIAKRTFFIAKQSILVGILLSFVLMAIFATGKFKPIYGAAIQELVDVVVILNALRAHGSFKKSKNA